MNLLNILNLFLFAYHVNLILPPPHDISVYSHETRTKLVILKFINTHIWSIS